MNYDIKIGFSRVNVNPPLGVSIGGYFEMRYSEGVLDDLEINTAVIEKDGKRIMISAIDNLEMATSRMAEAKEAIHKATGIDKEAIFISCTHTHTSPYLEVEEKNLSDIDIDHAKFVMSRFADSAVYAIADLCDAKMGYAKNTVKEHAFNRRYLMKDGTTETNPGVNHPGIEKCIGPVDDEMNLIRFLRADGKNIVMINYGNHPDVIGGNKVSADWPGHARRAFERAVPGTVSLFLNGAQGDLNHIKTNPAPGEMVDMIIDFDNVPRGYEYSKHLGNVIAGAAMQVYEKVNYTDTASVNYAVRRIDVPTNMPKPEEMEEARYIYKMYKEGRSAELPYKGMLLTTHLADASRKVRLENGPETLPMTLSAVSVGGIVFVGIPGEPFCGIGMGIKKAPDWNLIAPCCLVNGSEGYFPMQDSYDEGGYEAKSSPFRAGVAELIIDEAKKLIASL